MLRCVYIACLVCLITLTVKANGRTCGTPIYAVCQVIFNFTRFDSKLFSQKFFFLNHSQIFFCRDNNFPIQTRQHYKLCSRDAMQRDEERIPICVVQKNFPNLFKFNNSLNYSITNITPICYYYGQVFEFCYIFQPNIIHPCIKFRSCDYTQVCPGVLNLVNENCDILTKIAFPYVY